MATVSELRDQLARLQEIRAKGVSSYSIKDRTMSYRSDEELAAAIRDIERRIIAASGTPVRHVHFNSSKGI